MIFPDERRNILDENLKITLLYKGILVFPFLEEKNKPSQNNKEDNGDDGEGNVEDIEYVELGLVGSSFEIVGRCQVDIHDAVVFSM